MQVFTLYDEFLSEKKIQLVSPRTLDFYHDSVYCFLRWSCQQEGFNLVEVEALQRWAKRYLLSLVERPLSPYTIHTYGRGIRTFLKWVLAEGYIAGPLTFRCPPKPDKDIRPLSLGDARGMLQALGSDATLVGLRNQVILRTFVDTGIRLSELVNMTLRDLDLAARSIRVKGKGNKVRFVYLSLGTVKPLRVYLAQRRDLVGTAHDRVWIAQRGDPIGPSSVQSVLKRLKKRICFEGKLSPHVLRHTYAVLYLENGGDTLSLKELLGHEDLETTAEYVTFSRSQTKQLAMRYSPGRTL